MVLQSGSKPESNTTPVRSTGSLCVSFCLPWLRAVLGSPEDSGGGDWGWGNRAESLTGNVRANSPLALWPHAMRASCRSSRCLSEAPVMVTITDQQPVTRVVAHYFQPVVYHSEREKWRGLRTKGRRERCKERWRVFLTVLTEDTRYSFVRLLLVDLHSKA